MPSRNLIARLELQPHPEGGWYRELYRSATRVQTPRGERSALTKIYYLLEQNQFSRWHVIDSDEVWHFYTGAEIEVFSYDPQTTILQRHILGSPLDGRESVAVIPAGHWQAARTIDGFALVGCSVAPGFEFSEFRFVSAMPEHAEHFSGLMAPFADLL
jgi:uncharacterized protein